MNLEKKNRSRNTKHKVNCINTCVETSLYLKNYKMQLFAFEGLN